MTYRTAKLKKHMIIAIGLLALLLLVSVASTHADTESAETQYLPSASVQAAIPSESWAEPADESSEGTEETEMATVDASEEQPDDEAELQFAGRPRQFGPVTEIPAISQLPELFNGCELTSMTMLLNHLGQAYDKMELIDSLPYDPTPELKNSEGVIVQWGDPNNGFVGDIRGNGEGYAIFHAPLSRMLDELYEPGSLDMTGASFEEVERQLSDGKPVIAWTTEFFKPTDRWVQWKTPEGKTIEATFEIHTVLLVGSDEQYVILNDPLTGEQGKSVDKQLFIASWEQLGSQALTYAGDAPVVESL
jgi:uncharacterized protein YvpB